MELRFKNEVYDLSIKGIRKLLHNDVDVTFSEIDEPSEEAYEDLEKVHKLISNQEVKSLINECFCDYKIVFLEVKSDDNLVNALRSAGYKFEKSNVSRSLYAINDNGQEVRISDHKRPAIVENGSYVGEHNYEVELIIRENIVKGWQLRNSGFSKLKNSEYLLG